MDLNQYDTTAASETGAFLQLEVNGRKLVTDEATPKPIGLRFHGLESKAMRKLRHRQQNDRLKRIRVRGGGRVTGVSSEESEQTATELFAAACFEFVNITVDGQKQEYSLANAIKLFDRFPWIREQAKDFLEDDQAMLGEA